jgi:hypothetical protein
MRHVGRYALFLGLALSTILPVQAEVDCVTTHYSDGTCETTCVFFDEEGHPHGFMHWRGC